MSEFRCEVVRIQIEPHPNADQLELAKVGDYMAVVRKGVFANGGLAIYIPEQAVLPEWLLREMGLWDENKQKGDLHGSLGNRVKAIKLRGVLSQGLVLQCKVDSANVYSVDRPPQEPEFYMVDTETGRVPIVACEGDDLAEFLGITKYEPALPSHMKGRIVGVDFDATAKYDFDNLKKTPTLFDDGEDIVITEKVHGTLMQVGVVPSSHANEKYYKGRVVISSKGMGAKGFVLDHNDETNLYAQAAKKHGLLDSMLRVFGDLADRTDKPVFLFGEVFGKTESGAGVQDLTYTNLPLDFRAFDIAHGNRGNEDYSDWYAFQVACKMLGVYHVPMLYRGPYSKEVVLQHTDGQTTLLPPGNVGHIREGVVVKSAVESRNKHYGRKIAKSVSEAYLLRKGNATEFN